MKCFYKFVSNVNTIDLELNSTVGHACDRSNVVVLSVQRLINVSVIVRAKFYDQTGPKSKPVQRKVQIVIL